MNKRIILWQLWQNPFGPDDEEFVDESLVEEPAQFSDGYEELKECKIRPVMPTPMGFMPIHPYQSFTKQFQFWMGHTNFDITQDIKDKIESTAGVEILDIFTRYCFRIAVGKCFVGEDVKLDIQRTLNAMPPKKGEHNPFDMSLDENTEEKVKIIQDHLKDKFTFWAVYVLPNGEIDITGTNTQDGYDMHLDLYQRCQALAGGVIYTYA